MGNEATGTEALEILEERLGCIAISHLANLEKIGLLRLKPFQVAEETGQWDKWGYKEAGAATFQFETFVFESGIQWLATTTEHIFRFLNSNCGCNLSNKAFWETPSMLPQEHLENAKTTSVLNNIIKHEGSQLKPKSDNSRYICSTWSVPTGIDLDPLIHSHHEMFDIVGLIPKLYIFLAQLINQQTNADSWLDIADWRITGNELYEYLVPEVLELSLIHI